MIDSFTADSCRQVCTAAATPVPKQVVSNDPCNITIPCRAYDGGQKCYIEL